MIHPLYHVDEIAIICNVTSTQEVNGTECTITAPLEPHIVRLGLIVMTVYCYTCDTVKGPGWLIPPECLRKRFEPGDADFIRNLMAKPKELEPA